MANAANPNDVKFRLISDVLKMREAIRQERANERDIKARVAALSDEPLINLTDDMNNISSKLAKILPKHLVPRNLGPLSQVMWPFFYVHDFDYQDGADTTFLANERKESTVQVSQESGFIWTHIYRDFDDAGQSGFGAPLQLTIRDRQSSRQFVSEPIQLQHIGLKGEPTKLATPLVIMPNARITVEMESILTADFTVLNSTGTIRLVMAGYRMRMEDAQRVIEQVYL